MTPRHGRLLDHQQRREMRTGLPLGPGIPAGNRLVSLVFGQLPVGPANQWAPARADTYKTHCLRLWITPLKERPGATRNVTLLFEAESAEVQNLTVTSPDTQRREHGALLSSRTGDPRGSKPWSAARATSGSLGDEAGARGLSGRRRYGRLRLTAGWQRGLTPEQPFRVVSRQSQTVRFGALCSCTPRAPLTFNLTLGMRPRCTGWRGPTAPPRPPARRRAS